MQTKYYIAGKILRTYKHGPQLSRNMWGYSIQIIFVARSKQITSQWFHLEPLEHDAFTTALETS